MGVRVYLFLHCHDFFITNTIIVPVDPIVTIQYEFDGPFRSLENKASSKASCEKSNEATSRTVWTKVMGTKLPWYFYLSACKDIIFYFMLGIRMIF